MMPSFPRSVVAWDASIERTVMVLKARARYEPRIWIALPGVVFALPVR